VLPADDEALPSDVCGAEERSVLWIDAGEPVSIMNGPTIKTL